MARIAPLSGFPEWLPHGRAIERAVVESIQRTFELHGFAEIHTRAVEPLRQLLSKGETSKEVYVLRRLQAEDDDAGSTDKTLGLHFDLTVPFARYVLENAGHLAFPFKRYQVQSVWRGERPQEGRFREFTQADIDIVGEHALPFHAEVEVPVVIAQAFAKLQEIGVPPVQILVNNRKVAQGFYEGLGLEDVEGVLRTIDKLDKIGPDRVAELLQSDCAATADQAASCLALASIRGADASLATQVLALGVRTPLLDEGLDELVRLVEAAQERVPGVVVADLKIARGLDYYTGSVFETTLVGHENLGSVCSGGRYDSLASDGNVSYPGVGMSIGVTRIVSRILTARLARASRSVPTAVLVAVTDDDSRRLSESVAAELRARDIPTDVAPSAAKFGKQIKFADRRGIPYVWFPSPDGHQVKDIRTGDQVAADPGSWSPPHDDLRLRVRANTSG